MNEILWKKCLVCESKMCCKGYFPLSIFTTPEEKKRLPKINTVSPCTYLKKDGLCGCHKDRTFDCKLFPFDIIKEKGKFYWVIWDVDCPIIKTERHLFEEYLNEHETLIIPKVKEFLEAFNEWEDDEYKDKFKYEVIREVIIN